MDYPEARGIVLQILQRDYRGFEKLEEVLAAADRAVPEVAAAFEKIKAATEELAHIHIERDQAITQMAEEAARQRVALEETKASLGSEIDRLGEQIVGFTASAEEKWAALRNAERLHEGRLSDMEKELWSKRAEVSDEITALKQQRDELKAEIEALKQRFA